MSRVAFSTPRTAQSFSLAVHSGSCPTGGHWPAWGGAAFAVGGAASAQGRCRSYRRWYAHRPQRVHAFSFVVQVADHIMALRFSLTLLGCLGLAALGGIGAAGLELAAGRRVCRGRNGSLQHNTLAAYGRVRMGWPRTAPWVGGSGWAKMSSVSPYSTRLPRYMTPTVSEICSTTLRS